MTRKWTDRKKFGRKRCISNWNKRSPERQHTEGSDVSSSGATSLKRHAAIYQDILNNVNFFTDKLYVDADLIVLLDLTSSKLPKTASVIMGLPCLTDQKNLAEIK